MSCDVLSQDPEKEQQVGVFHLLLLRQSFRLVVLGVVEVELLAVEEHKRDRAEHRQDKEARKQDREELKAALVAEVLVHDKVR